MSATAVIGRLPPSAGSLEGAASPVAALAGAVLTFFVIMLDAVVVNVALPGVRRDPGGGIAGLQWVVDGYTAKEA